MTSETGYKVMKFSTNFYSVFIVCNIVRQKHNVLRNHGTVNLSIIRNIQIYLVSL